MHCETVEQNCKTQLIIIKFIWDNLLPVSSVGLLLGSKVKLVVSSLTYLPEQEAHRTKVFKHDSTSQEKDFKGVN